MQEFTQPLKELIEEYQREASTTSESSNKKIVLEYYITEINECIENLQLLLEQSTNVIHHQNYDEKLTQIKKENNISKNFIDTFGPLMSVYTLL